MGLNDYILGKTVMGNVWWSRSTIDHKLGGRPTFSKASTQISF